VGGNAWSGLPCEGSGHRCIPPLVVPPTLRTSAASHCNVWVVVVLLVLLTLV
jgi:hypothetical protein